MIDGRPLAVDLFCKAGGVTAGLRRAGYCVIGVDIEPQPRYPGDLFIQADVFEIFPRLLAELPAVLWTASPPCRDHTRFAKVHGLAGSGWMLREMLALFEDVPAPWIVENVADADMPGSVVLCGSMFGLGARCRDGEFHQLWRHRRFSSNRLISAPSPCRHDGRPVGVYGHGGGQFNVDRADGSGRQRSLMANVSESRAALGIDWMTQAELAQAIPPAFAECLGRQVGRQ